MAAEICPIYCLKKKKTLGEGNEEQLIPFCDTLLPPTENYFENNQEIITLT